MTAFVVASAGHDWGRLGRMGARLPISINASMNMMLNDALGADGRSSVAGACIPSTDHR